MVRTWEGSGSTCGSLCHNHHRTTAGPGTEENIHINRCYHVGTDLEIKAEDTRALIEGVEQDVCMYKYKSRGWSVMSLQNWIIYLKQVHFYFYFSALQFVWAQIPAYSLGIQTQLLYVYLNILLWVFNWFHPSENHPLVRGTKPSCTQVCNQSSESEWSNSWIAAQKVDSFKNKYTCCMLKDQYCTTVCVCVRACVQPHVFRVNM